VGAFNFFSIVIAEIKIHIPFCKLFSRFESRLWVPYLLYRNQNVQSVFAFEVLVSVGLWQHYHWNC